MQVLQQQVLQYDQDAWNEAKDNRSILDVAQGRKVHRLKVIRFGPTLENMLQPVLVAIVVLVAHGVRANIEGEADGLRCLLHVAPTLHNVVRRDLEGRRAVLLLKAAGEVALMVVLPFKHAADLVDEF